MTWKYRNGFGFDRQSMSWSLRLPGRPGWGIAGVSGLVRAGGRDCRLDQADTLELSERRRGRLAARCVFGKAGFAWNLEFAPLPDRPAVAIRSEIVNESAAPLVLAECRVAQFERARGARLDLGAESGRETVLHYAGDWLDYVGRAADNNGEHRLGPICHLHNPAAGAAYCAGFVTFERATPEHRVVWRAGLALHQAVCRYHDYSLPPGGRIASETLLVELASEPYGVLERWAEAVRDIYQPPIPARSSAGWVGGAWADPICGREKPEDIVERNCAAIRRRLAGFGIEYIWIGIVNLKHCLPGNWLQFSRRFFPRGVKRMLGRLRRWGFKPGFWVGAFLMAEDADTLPANRGNLLRGADGAPAHYCAGSKAWLWPWSSRKNGKGSKLYCLDGSHPKTRAFFRKVFAAYRKLGLRYYMLDFLSAGMPGKNHAVWDKTLVKGYEVYRAGLRAIRRAAGRDTRLLSAVGSGPQNVGLVSAARIGQDYGEGRHASPAFPSYPATYVLNTPYDGVGPSHRNALQNLGATYFTHRRLWLNDLNILTLDQPISLNEAQISASLFGLSGSSVMLGDDLAAIGEDRLALIKKILPRTPDTAFPADLFSRLPPADCSLPWLSPRDYSRVLAAPVRKPWGSWTVVGVFNLEDTPAEIAVTPGELRLAEGEYRVFDFWEQRYCGAIRGRLDVALPPMSCRVLRLEGVRRHPWILSTDMHLRQGQVELEDVRWDARRLALEGVCVRPRGETGNIFLVAPPGFKPVDYAGLWVAKDMNERCLIIRQRLDFVRSRLAWRVVFERVAVKEFVPPAAEQWAAGQGAAILRDFMVSALLPPAADIRAVSPPGRGVCAWPRRARLEGRTAGFLDVRAIHDGRDGLIFLRARFDAPRAGAGRLIYGADGPVKVWINGAPADCRPHATNPAIPGQYRARARWRRGANEIVFALASNRGNAWGIFAAAAPKDKRINRKTR